MNRTPKIEGWKIRRLYGWLASGIYDDELLLEVGWQLYARCEVVVAIWHAGHSAVPCPACQHPVPRLRPYRAGPPNGYAPRRGIACPSCQIPVSWADCRIALRGRPLCLECGQLLQSDSRSGLSCAGCATQISWKKYRGMLRTRVRLPCPSCGHRLRKAEVSAGQKTFIPGGDSGIRTEVLKLLAVPDYGHSKRRTERRCPECGRRGEKRDGRFHCAGCGYDVKWRSYKDRLRTSPERLKCEQCGHGFDWQTWARSNGVLNAYTGNPAPAAEFIIRWPRSRTPEEQMMAIDQLIHGVHVRGALAHHFIRGKEADVVGLLNELAMNA